MLDFTLKDTSESLLKAMNNPPQVIHAYDVHTLCRHFYEVQKALVKNLTLYKAVVPLRMCFSKLNCIVRFKGHIDLGPHFFLVHMKLKRYFSIQNNFHSTHLR